METMLWGTEKGGTRGTTTKMRWLLRCVCERSSGDVRHNLLSFEGLSMGVAAKKCKLKAKKQAQKQRHVVFPQEPHESAGKSKSSAAHLLFQPGAPDATLKLPL